jgi:hypothetical protein
MVVAFVIGSASLVAVELMLVIAAGQTGHTMQDLPRFQEGDVSQGGNSPPPFDTSEADFELLRVGPHYPKITSTITYCVLVQAEDPVSLPANEVAVKAAFSTWDDEVDDVALFNAASPITDCDEGGPRGSAATGVVQWGSLAAGIAGLTELDFGSPDFSAGTVPIARFTITLSSDLTNWSVSAGAGDYGIQDVVTHEVGHVVGLDDLRSIKDLCLTMFGGASTSDTRQQTLAVGDKLGAHAIYGGTATTTVETACDR